MTDVVRVWGTISLVAIHSEPMPVNLLAMFSRELNMHASRLYTWEAWEEAIRLGATGAVMLGRPPVRSPHLCGVGPPRATTPSWRHSATNNRGALLG